MLRLADLLSRRQKQLALVAMDLVLFAFTVWGAMAIREGTLQPNFRGHFLLFWGLLVAVRIPIFVRLGLYRAALRYPSTQITRISLLGVGLSTLAFGTALFLLQPDFASRSAMLFIEPLLAALAVIGSRELLAHSLVRHHARRSEREPVLIYGAGVAGLQLAQSLRVGDHLRPVAFVDDDPSKWGMRILDLDVHPPGRLQELVERYGIVQALLAAPSTDVAERRGMLERLEAVGLRVKEVPGILEMLLGGQSVSQLHEVSSADLLPRRCVVADGDLLSRVVSGRSVMVTGAGGSIGSELCRQIAALGPKRIVLYEINEYALYRIEMELAERWPDLEVAAVLGSVLDEPRLKEVYRRFAVETVYHAAAYKHVPLVEQNPMEGVRNNVFGTFLAARAAAQCGVSDFLLVSTDKAVRPTGVMGASKRLAEQVCLMVGERARLTPLRYGSGEPLRCSIVRFGNVLDSAGSVVPLLRRQIARGGPVTVTHRDITRYFMTITEAAQLVLQAGALAEGGEVFLLDMGRPVRVYDLAKKMVELATRGTDREIEIRITGLRPGEKLEEELLVDPEHSRPTTHPKIFKAVEDGAGLEELDAALLRLEEALQRGALDEVYAVLAATVEGYRPPAEVVDVLRRGGCAYSFAANGNGHAHSLAQAAAPGAGGPGEAVEPPPEGAEPRPEAVETGAAPDSVPGR